MNIEEITIKVDVEDIKRRIADCLDPGAVLLPAKAVQELFKYLDHPDSIEQVYELLTNCGGIRSSGAAE